MEERLLIHAVDTHTMGEPTRVVVGGLPPLPGTTAAQKRDYLATHLDHIRTALMHEPRGHADMFGAVLLEPTMSGADLAVVFMDHGGYLDMCGHGIIGAVVAALEAGAVRPPAAGRPLRVETPAGLVEAEPHGREVSFVNVPAFLERAAVPVAVRGLGTVPVDIAYGGNYFGLVDAEGAGLELDAAGLGRLRELGLELRQGLRRACLPVHPQAGPRGVDLVEFYGPPRSAGAHGRNVVVFGQGQWDRSPCGTGTCAKMAALHAKGLLPLGQDYVHESLIGTTFTGRLLRAVSLGGRRAVVPRITARAYVTGIGQFVIEPDDPLRFGFWAGGASPERAEHCDEA